MKKLSLLIASLLCVTIGGVYATWYYASSGKVESQHTHFSLGITGTDTAGTYGNYYINVNTNIKMWVDPAGTTADQSHITALYFGSETDNVVNAAEDDEIMVTLKYLPGENMPATDFDNGIITKWSLKSSIALDAWTFGGEQIFDAIDSTSFTIYPYGTTTDGVNAVTAAQCWEQKATDGAFYYKITVGQIKALIDLNEIELDTLEKHGNYLTALNSGKIGITIEDGRTVSGS